MAQAADVEHGFRHFKGFFMAGSFEHGQNWAQFFVRQRKFVAHAFEFSNQQWRILWHIDASPVGNLPSALANDPRVNRHLVGVDHGFGELLDVFLLNEVGALRGEFFLHVVVNRGVNHGALFRRADHAVIKALGKHDVVNRLLDVSGGFDVSWRIPGPNAQRWLT